MIIVCNGGFKSGSTWLLNIVRHLTRTVSIADIWQNQKWSNESIDPEKLDEFIEMYKAAEETYVSKNHLSSEVHVELLTNKHRSNVHVVTIMRDIRDVVVSAYYHNQRVNGTEESFDEYFSKRGLNVAARVCDYNAAWNIEGANVFVSSYERLQLEGMDEIKKISDFLGLDQSGPMIKSVFDLTRFSTLKELTNSDHMRKGVIGDWKNHLSAEQEASLRSKLPGWAFSVHAD